jgi:hypothetical protein
LHGCWGLEMQWIEVITNIKRSGARANNQERSQVAWFCINFKASNQLSAWDNIESWTWFKCEPINIRHKQSSFAPAKPFSNFKKYIKLSNWLFNLLSYDCDNTCCYRISLNVIDDFSLRLKKIVTCVVRGGVSNLW